MVLRAVFTVVLAMSIKFVIDSVFDGPSGASVWSVAAILLGGLAVSFGAGLVAARLTAIAAADIIADVRTQTFEHVQRLPMRYYDRVSTGDLMAHFSSDIAQLSQGVISKPLVGLRALAAMALYIPAMFLLNTGLAVAAVVVIPTVVYAVYRWAPASASALDAEKERIADVLEEVAANTRAQKLIRAFALGNQTRDRFLERVTALREASVLAERRIALETVIAEYAVEAAKVLLIVVGTALAFSGSLDPGSFAAFVAILTEFAYQASVVGMDVLPSIKRSAAGIRRIDALLDEEPENHADRQLPCPQLASEIVFEEVVLRYRADDPPQLNGLSMTVPAESYVAIVGPNGSGKSSILNVLLGIYELESGRIVAGGVDVHHVVADEIRRRTGMAFQETILFDASIRENIAVAGSADGEELANALARSDLEPVIARLPNGIDTVVGVDGVMLSIGEIQRIGIARALLRNPDLILLDEVASGLDPATEADVFSTVESLRDGRTIINVTHRLETVKTADLIFVLEEGRVVESGRFDELITSGGHFAAMWAKQHGFDVSANGLSASVEPERLSAVPLFSELDRDVLTDLSTAFESQLFAAGEVIFAEGESGDAFYVIARGVVDVVHASDTGVEDVLAVLEDGDFFGEMALLSHERRNATVRSRGSSTLLRLDRRSFTDLLAVSPEARNAINLVAQTRQRANSR
jgi:ATP-binding cassette subfamily B protein